MIFLLDTNTLIHMVRGLKITAPKGERQKQRLDLAKAILHRCRTHQGSGDDVGVSAITVAELEYGARHSGDYQKEIRAVRKVLTPFLRYDFDATNCAEHYGEVRHAVENAGAPIGAMDLLIASHAKSLGATLVTSDIAHFPRVSGLKCENWAA